MFLLFLTRRKYVKQKFAKKLYFIHFLDTRTLELMSYWWMMPVKKFIKFFTNTRGFKWFKMVSTDISLDRKLYSEIKLPKSQVLNEVST